MRRLLTFFVLAAAVAAAAFHVRDLRAAGQFDPHNLVVYRIGDGVATLGTASAAVFLDEYTTSGSLVQSIPMPTAPSGNNRALTATGTATSEGELTLSVDGHYLVAAGYNAPPGTAGIAGTSSTGANPVTRVIARIDSNGSIDTTTALTDANSGGNPRGVVSGDGLNFWLSGSVSGIRYAALGATTSTSVSNSPTGNLRSAGIFNGQLYASSSSSGLRLATVGSGLPTTAGQTTTELPGDGTNDPATKLASPYGFFFAHLNTAVAGNAVDTVYVADDSASPKGGILKFSLNANNMWALNGTVSSSVTLRHVTGTVAGNVVTLYAAGQTALVTLTDSSGYNGAFAGTPTTIATAGANEVFRGVAFAPAAAATSNPSGTGAASPSSVAAGSPTLLTVHVTPGTLPASTGIAVTVDLSSIGGSAAQPFFDDGTNGDAVAGDNIFSFQATVSGATTTGAKSIAAAITDAQSRTGSATISLTVTAPVSLSGVGAANPSPVQAGNSTLLTVTVTAGTSPASTGIAVTADLSTISGSANQAFFDDGTHGDVTAGDNVFSYSATIPSDAAGGPRTLAFTIADAQSRSAFGGIGLSVTASNTPTPPTGTGSAVPSSVPAGGAAQLTVTVTPGTNPASTGLSVTGDLSAIGGSNTQSFQASSNTFSFAATVDAATTPALKMLPITVSDGQGRSSNFTISVTVTAPLANSTIVISQIYPGSSSATASYTNDFVELYNRGSVTVDITGWSLQYAAATGTGDWSSRQPLGGTIAPGQYYLIAMASGGGGLAPLPPSNVSSQINMGQSAGKIAITDSGDLLTGAGGCPSSTHIKDLVGYGSTANCWEGTGPAAVPAALTTTALFRQGGGSIDTNDNKNDFFVTGPPNPALTPMAPIVPLPPAVFVTYPATNDTNIPRDATIEVTFTETVTVDPGWFDISCATTGPHDDATEAPDGINRWITPNTNFVQGELCTVAVFKTKVHDADNDSPPQDYTWSFTVASGAAPPEPADVHLLMGNPTSATADINQPNNYLMSKPEYALSYNRDLGRPNWVSWHLSSPWIPSNHPARVDTFRPDPQVPPDWYRVQSFDFSGSGFDRGHMDPNADRESSTPVNQATFLMSNMVAQSHDNNAGPWEDFENYLRSVVQGDPNNLNEVYIVAGPQGTGGTGTNGPATTTAGGHVTVPAVTWKVALVLPDNGTEDDISRVTCSTRTIAVVTPNIVGISANPWEMYLTTVSTVETLTGYHFFTNLPQPIQNCIKAGTNGVNPKNDQTITFAPIGDQPFGVDVALQATASSGLAVTLAVTSGPATIVNGTTLHFTGVGAVTVQATQSGNVNYNAAPPVSQTFNVTLGSQTITFDGPAPTPTYGDPAFQVSATGGASGNAVTLAASGACSASSQPSPLTITIVSAGVCTVTASQAGNVDYDAAQASEAITIGMATPSFAGLSSPTIEAGTATTTIGGSIAFGVLIPTGAISVTLNGVTQTAAIQANGSFASAFATGALAPAATPYAIAYSYAGDSNFNGASGVSALTVVDTTAPVITVPANLTVNATSTAGASVTFTASAVDAVDGARSVTCIPASGSTFAVGTTAVNCTAADLHGNSASAGFSVTVNPFVKNPKPPKVTAPPNMKVEATGPSGAVVTFTASATDPQDGTLPVVCAPASGSVFPLGATTVTCSATNSLGKLDTDTAVITVRDTTAPTIVSLAPSVTVLPNTDQTVPVSIAAVATDLVDPAPACQITRVTGGASDLDNDGVIDWTVTGPLTLNVQSVARKNKDRTYTITVQCTDAAGNHSKEKTTVVVSHVP